MGLFKLIRYRKYRRERKKLKTDMLSTARQEAVTICMSKQQFLEAMRLIKELWELKTCPWSYSTSIVNYIECLIRMKRFRDIDLLEKELLHFYRSVMDISAGRLMSFAHEIMKISPKTKTVHASILSFYAAILAQRHLPKKPAMKLAGESINFMKDAVADLQGQTVVQQYLLALMRRLRDYLNATKTKKKAELKLRYLEHSEKVIKEVKNGIKQDSSGSRLVTTRKKKSKITENGGKRKQSRSSSQEASISENIQEAVVTVGRSASEMINPTSFSIENLTLPACSRSVPNVLSTRSVKSRRSAKSPTAPPQSASMRKKRLSDSSQESDLESELPSSRKGVRKPTRNGRSIHKVGLLRLPSESASESETVETHQTESQSSGRSTASTSPFVVIGSNENVSDSVNSDPDDIPNVSERSSPTYW